MHRNYNRRPKDMIPQPQEIPKYSGAPDNEVPVITKYTLWSRQITVICMAHNPDKTNRYNENAVLTNQMLDPDNKFYPNITKFSRLQASELPALTYIFSMIHMFAKIY